jgi:hypothetical protein
MNKFTYILKILKDRWISPYDEIILRFNTKALENDPLVWRIFINGVENLASSFEIHGYVYDVVSYDGEIKKLNVGCKGRVRWVGSKAIIFAIKKDPEILLS